MWIILPHFTDENNKCGDVKISSLRGACLVQLVKRVTLDLKIMSFTPTLSMKPT